MSIREILNPPPPLLDRAAVGAQPVERPRLRVLGEREEAAERFWSDAGASPFDARRVFPVLDATVALACLSLLVAWVGLPDLLPGEGWLDRALPLRALLMVAGGVVLWRLSFQFFDLYEPGPSAARDLLPRVAAAAVPTTAWVSLLAEPGLGRPGPMGSVLFWCLATASTVAVRHGVQALRTSARPAKPLRVLLVGVGPRGQRVFHQLRARHAGMELVGCMDLPDQEPLPEMREHWIGGLDRLEEVLTRSVVDEVLIALPTRSCYEEIQRVIGLCERVGVHSKYLADVFECAVARAQYAPPASGPAWVSMHVATDDYRLSVKRAVDVLGAVVGLALLAPLFALIALGIKLTSPGPVFYVQERYGFNRRRFPMYKFRTMVPGAEEMQADLEALNEVRGPAFKLREDPRVTPFGRFLRRFSLDELPQLWNVLRGEMSLVGPRPLPLRDVSRFDQDWLMRRFSVLPGLTCLWQITGRSNLDFDDWIALDLQYIDRWTLMLDCWILLKTIPAVLRGDGAA